LHLGLRTCDVFPPVVIDAWPGLAPCGSFPPNELGILDLIGNAAEIVVDGGAYVAVGGSYRTTDLNGVADWFAVPLNGDERRPEVGFRCVWVFSGCR
jgi:formylglycine-generating enzyme required for sulfatase activity